MNNDKFISAEELYVVNLCRDEIFNYSRYRNNTADHLRKKLNIRIDYLEKLKNRKNGIYGDADKGQPYDLCIMTIEDLKLENE